MSRIEDYGDKIGGAKKDNFSDYVLKLSSAMGTDPDFLRSLSLTDAFPKPDYEGLSDRGVSKDCLDAICVARGTISRKPTGRSATYKAMLSWMREIGKAREVAIAALGGEQGPEKDAQVRDMIHTLGENVRKKFEAMSDVPVAYLNGAESLSVMNYRGKVILINQGRKILAEHPDIPGNEDAARAAMTDAIMRHSVKFIATPKKRTPEEKARDTAGKVRIYRSGRTLSIELNTAGGKLVFAEGFGNLKDARRWFAENKEEIVAKILDVMGTFPERTGHFRQRTGPARRNGDITAEMLADRFGIRGIEFGNYVEGPRRQADLNAMWDSLSDMAEAIEVPERIVGYDGALAVAFGARGGGHAAAHYERDRRVFNLTKSSGAGATAHEWLHSADNAAVMENSTDKNERTLRMMSTSQSPEMSSLKEAWSGYAERMAELDATRSKPYWSKPEELAARCFEVWLVDRLKANGIVNDHLVEIDRDSRVYPDGDEMRLIRPAMDRFMIRLTSKLLLDAGLDRDSPAKKVEPAAAKPTAVVAAAKPEAMISPPAPAAARAPEQMTFFQDLDDDAEEFTFG